MTVPRNPLHDVAIVAKGNNVKHYLNGRLILDFTDNNPDLALKSGVIALHHVQVACPPGGEDVGGE